MDVGEVRRGKLLALYKKFTEVHAGATDKDFALAHDLNPKHWSQIKNRSKGSRDIGHNLARRIETRINAPRGYLDSPDAPAPAQRNGHGLEVPRIDNLNGHTRAPKVDGVVERIELSAAWVRANIPDLTGPGNLAFVIGFGDSMCPTYQHGDVLFVDRGVQTIAIDAVYAFTLVGELYIKRVQRLPNQSLKVISDNERYEPFTISAADKAQLRVDGRIVGAMNWRRM